ncbi:hypothetical protein INT43_008577 [Umbelopsis isabellina]|uniref:Nucleolar protein 12 n=1 Tax=Mortierella isabellina TaxID=91625 RepID=A0A8H7UFE7_MORIS|nr:hypothetical protein INT43_008577 [Umbelopsis isabellina]
MTTTYTPGALSQSLFGSKESAVDNTVDELFKNSAGPSQVVLTPAFSNTSQATAKVDSASAKLDPAQTAREAVSKAKSITEIITEKKKEKKDLKKRKAEEEKIAEASKKAKLEEEKVKKSVEDEKERQIKQKKEEQEKNERTVFVGNLPVSTIQKENYKDLKKTFAEYGEIVSIRFRSIAFSELLPRKAAFISGKLHPERDVLNAYVVYTDKASAEKALEMNAQVFHDKHLRVDSAANPKNHDRKKSVFVGSLPFDAQEEQLWEFFKECGDIENVRIVRDAKTNIGKGIAYVQFSDRDSVDLALQLKDKKFGGKRKLRLDRCKLSVSEGGKPSNMNDKRGGKGAKGANGANGAKGARSSNGQQNSKPQRKFTNSKNTNENLSASAFEGTRATKDDKSAHKPKKHRIRARTIAYKQKTKNKK